MTYHERFMLLALAEAESAASAGEVPVGAVIVRAGEPIVAAHNETVGRSDPTAHAEILAISRASSVVGRDRLTGCSLYVTLEPCPMCAGAIVLSRLDQVVFGAYDARAGAAGSLYSITQDPRLNHRTETLGGVLDHPCGTLLRAFFASRREAGFE